MRRKTLRRRLVDSSPEKLIVTGLITSNEFMSSIHNQVKPHLFKMEFAGIVAKWCKEYYLEQGTVPGEIIQDIFEIEKENLPPAVQTITGDFLSGLSEAYEQSRSFNPGYMTGKAEKYFSERRIDNLLSNAERFARADKYDRARSMIQTYLLASDDATTGLIDVLADSTVNKYGMDEEEVDIVLSGEGALGHLFGKLKRSWLVALAAPMKRGKTWYLDQFALDALYSGRTVFKFSLEMPQRQQMDRLYKMISGLTTESELITVPCFDCINNQDGTCRLPQRTCDVRLAIGEDEESGELLLPEFKSRMRYKVCTECRGDRSDNFIPAVWFNTRRTRKKTITKLRKAVKQFKVHTGGRFSADSFSFDATIENIRSRINDKILTDGLQPDVIIIDYADIINMNELHLSERGRHDQTWKTLKNIAKEYNCLVLTATQGNRQSFEQATMHERNISEDARKMAHVDAMFTLNQTAKERTSGVMRVKMLNHRHSERPEKEVIVLQSLKIGAPVIDSEWTY